MSYYSEHQRLRTVLEKAQALNIGSNPAPYGNSVSAPSFNPLQAVLQMMGCAHHSWCTPRDHPEGWEEVEMDQGAFSKPCAFVASVFWRWNGGEAQPRIVGLNLTTTAYALRDHWRKQPQKQMRPAPTFVNRPSDVAWAREKIRWLFQEAGPPVPPIYTEKE